MAVLKVVGQIDNNFAPPTVPLPPSVRGNGLPSKAVKEAGVDKMIQGPHPGARPVCAAQKANAYNHQVSEDGHWYDGGHQNKAGAALF